MVNLVRKRSLGSITVTAMKNAVSEMHWRRGERLSYRVAKDYEMTICHDTYFLLYYYMYSRFIVDRRLADYTLTSKLIHLPD